jgi:hypothetical protein
MHELRLGPGRAPVFTDPRRDRGKSALIVPEAHQANLTCGVRGSGNCLRMIGQLDQSRCGSGIEWLLEKGHADVSAVVMLPEDQLAVEEGGAHVQICTCADQGDFAAGVAGVLKRPSSFEPLYWPQGRSTTTRPSATTSLGRTLLKATKPQPGTEAISHKRRIRKMSMANDSHKGSIPESIWHRSTTATPWLTDLDMFQPHTLWRVLARALPHFRRDWRQLSWRA